MSRLLVSALVLLLCAAWIVPTPVMAGEDAPAVASDEEAQEAIDTFKTEYKAKGLKGDDKLMQRDWAMRELAKLQHPDIVAELAKHSKKKGDLATLAVIYLGEQSEFPGAAGKSIIQSMRKNKKDGVLVMSGLQSVAELGYLGAREELSDLIRSRDFAMKKYAIQTAGNLGDVRMMGDLLKLLGIDIKNEKQQDGGKTDDEKKSGEKEVVEEGYSWEGAEVHYDTGTAGDGDQKEAERQGKEKLAANKAAAEAGRSSGGGGISGVGGAGGGAGGGRGGGSSRSMQELTPTILKALYAMTGEKFEKGSEIKAWLKANADQLKERSALLDQMEKAQRK